MSSTAETPAVTTGDQVAGYRIERLLGRGGMAAVFEATQLALERRVALKILPPELSRDDVFLERFRREGVLQATLEHPHIVTVHEAGVDRGRPFIAMRLVPGATLKQLIRTDQVDGQRALRLLGGIAGALDAAHAAGLVHRDVKPENVLVDEDSCPYLADFGLTRTPASPSLTQSGEFLGTPAYVAPEQIQGEPATAASDNYAFAAVLFECLTGRVPYPRESLASVSWAHVNDPAPRVTDLRPDLPAAIDAVLARGLAVEPGDRFPSAACLVAAARHALQPVDATASAGLPAVIAERPVRRRRRLGLPATAVSTMLLCGFAFETALAPPTTDERPGPPVAQTERVEAPGTQAGPGKRLAPYEASFYRTRVPPRWIATQDERPAAGGRRRSQWRTPHDPSVSLTIDAIDGATVPAAASAAAAAEARRRRPHHYKERLFGTDRATARPIHVWAYRVGRLETVEYFLTDCGDAFRVRGAARPDKYARLMPVFRQIAESVRSRCG